MPSRCDKCLHYFRICLTLLFSHVGLCALVVGYSILGAVIFEALEAHHEKMKRLEVIEERQKMVDSLWEVTSSLPILKDTNWTQQALPEIHKFELKVVKAVRKEGFDGKEDSPLQWSFSGALLYSIIVITTIGYGNVAPKTPWGKVVTVIYAIVGIPLLLLCLSNIGDVMAHSFKFLYWKVCCYLCVKPKRKKKVTYKHAQYPSAKFSSGGGEVEFKNSPPGTPKTPKATDDVSSSSYYTAPESPLSPEISFKPNFKFDPPDACSVAVITNKYVLQNCEESFCRPEYNIPVTIKDNSRRWEVMNIGQGSDSDLEQEEITVPIILCVLLVIGYICGGAILFSLWEDWDFLDSSYFCFVTLTTIGFGDLVPGSAVVSDDNQLTLGLCSLYLMLGMALLAMSFNLVQEEVIKTVRSIGKRIGILSDDDDDDDEDN